MVALANGVCIGKLPLRLPCIARANTKHSQECLATQNTEYRGMNTECHGIRYTIPRQHRGNTLLGRNTAPNTAGLALAYVQYRRSAAICGFQLAAALGAGTCKLRPVRGNRTSAISTIDICVICSICFVN